MRVTGGRRRVRAVPGTVLTAAIVLVLSACGSTSVAVPEPEPAVVVPVAKVSAILAASPANGTTRVLTDATPKVSVARGKLSSVLLRDASGVEVPGTVGGDGAGWHATGALAEGKRYTFDVRGTDENGHPFANSSSFSTIDDDNLVKAWISPLAGMTVGIGQPIAVEFSHPVVDRAEVERHLRVETSTPVVGAWHWESDTVVHYRPFDYWPANTKVVLHSDLKGLDMGGGRFGDENRTIPFSVGRAQIAVVDVKTHRMQVFRDGQLIRTIAVSTGKKGYLTRGGTKVVLGMERKKHMTGEGIGIKKDAPDYFDLHVEYAVRMTWSGEFLHAAPWQGSNHGRANVSHGCVGMSTSQAKWYFEHTIVGDVVKVLNSPRKMELRNGYGDWNLSWSEWVAGSALPHTTDAPAAGQAVDPTSGPAAAPPGSGTPTDTGSGPGSPGSGSALPRDQSNSTASPAPVTRTAAPDTGIAPAGSDGKPPSPGAGDRTAPGSRATNTLPTPAPASTASPTPRSAASSAPARAPAGSHG